MNKIGIIQGRVMPEELTELQVFPKSNWFDELFEIKNIGFDYYEVLYDKSLFCKQLLVDDKSRHKLNISGKRSRHTPRAESLCADYFTLLSAHRDWETFELELIKLINLLHGTSVNLCVLPFFHRNLVDTEYLLKNLLTKLCDNNIDSLLAERKNKIALEMTFPSNKIIPTLNSFDFENIGLCVDLGNLGGAGLNTVEEIGMLREKIFHVHVKDKNINGTNVMLGSGSVEIKNALEKLVEVGYTGQLILETPYTQNPVQDASDNLTYILDICEKIF